MSDGGRIRFVHSAHWRLDLPLGGLGPEADLADPLWTDAPLAAVTRSIDLAIAHQVDFMLLGGLTLAASQAPPYLLQFVLREFGRLAENQIPLYWYGAEVDADRWPQSLRLPESVRMINPQRAEVVPIQRTGHPPIHLIAGGPPWRATDPAKIAEYLSLAAGQTGTTLAMVNGPLDPARVAGRAVHYWAVNDSSQYRILSPPSQPWSVAPGSPQSRDPDESGDHGLVLVELPAEGEPHVELLSTEQVRYETHSLTVPVDASLSDARDRLEELVRGRLATRAAQIKCRLVVTIELDFDNQLPSQVHPHLLRQQWLPTIERRQLGKDLWVGDIRWKRPELPETIREEDTILGDYVRTLQQQKNDQDAWGRLAAYLPESPEIEQLQAHLAGRMESQRQSIWQEAEAEGALLLQGIGLVGPDSREEPE